MTLIDTGPLVALVDARDAWHAKALRQFRTVGQGTLYTCDAVLTEVCFHLPHRAQRLRLRSVIEEFRIATVAEAGGPGFWGDVLDWLEKYAEHDPDWADGSIAVLSGRRLDLTVWTYDREFRTTWRRPDGTPIPITAK